MSADPQTAVLECCIELDSVAYQVYAEFAKSETTPELRTLWVDLGRDEAEHIGYWKTLIRLRQEGVVPEYFDDPTVLGRTLEEASRNMHELMGSIHSGMDGQKRLTVACLMELTFLHQPLLQVLRYARTAGAGEDPLEAYNRHLQGFLTGVGTLGTSLDLRLSVEALRRMWAETRGLLDRAYTDPLTGLLNRRGLRDTATPLANLAKRNGGTIAVAMADIDKFKAINDAHGHEVGDRVLTGVAETIRRCVRASDLVARVGGEEFLVYLSEVEASRVPAIGEKIRAEVERSLPGGLAVTVSMGLASLALARSSDVGDALDSLTRAADERLYRAKSEGRNRVVS